MHIPGLEREPVPDECPVCWERMLPANPRRMTAVVRGVALAITASVPYCETCRRPVLWTPAAQAAYRAAAVKAFTRKTGRDPYQAERRVDNGDPK